MKIDIKKCWHTPEHVFTMDDIHYYASDEHNINKFDGDVIINLTSTPNVPQSILPELKEHYDIPLQEIMIPWPDFGKPKVKLSFWETIHRIIKHKGWKTVCVHCGHGHGRTGTALSCILVSMCGTSAIDAVEVIRKYHCNEAVETPEQCSYIMEVDQHYNKREPTEENFPQPSMLINWEELEYMKEVEEKDESNANMGVDKDNWKMTVEEIAEEMFDMVEEYHGKKSVKPTDLIKAMKEKFGEDQCDKKLCKLSIRELIDSGRCVYSYAGGSYIVLPPEPEDEKV